MKQAIFFISFLLLFVSTSAVSQDTSREGLKGPWYTTDGSNELVLLVTDKFALFESQFWEISQASSDKLLLKNSEAEVELQITPDGKAFILENGSKKTPIQPEKSTDLKNRTVGHSDVSDSFLNPDQVQLQGVYIAKDSLPSTISIIYNHAFSDGQKQFTGDVDAEGRFNVVFPLDYPQEVMVSIGDSFFTYFSSPGAKQGMVIDESSFGADGDLWTQAKAIDFMGDLAVENEERRLLQPEFMKARNYAVTDSLTKRLDPDDFLAYRLDLMKSHEEFFRSYFDSVPVSPLIRDISLRGARTYAANDLRRYIWMHKGSTAGRLSPIDVSEEYVQDVKNLIPNDWEDLMTSDYAGLVREFTMPIQPYEMKKLIERNMQVKYSYFKALSLSESQNASVESWYEQVKKGVPRDSLVLSDEFNELENSNKSQNSALFSLVGWEHFLGKISSLGIIPRSCMIATFLDMNFERAGLAVPQVIQNQLDSLQMEPQVLALVKEKSIDFELAKNARFVEGVEIADNSENILAQLKAKYPGQVIYIDVWATWCGPCINEFKYAESLKKEAPEGVIFTYICAQSDRTAFDVQIKKYGLVGDHFFLDNIDFQHFDKEYKITGFPTYMIVTKEGKLIREGIQRPSSGQTLIEQLKELNSR